MLLAQITDVMYLMVSLIPTMIFIVTWIIFLIALWRGMKAHESIAQSIRRIADKQK